MNFEKTIRPERVIIKKVTANTKTADKIVVTATVCELLGAEYSVHFNLFGIDFVAKMNAKTRLTEGDKITVELPKEDILVFDPITGEVI